MGGYMGSSNAQPPNTPAPFLFFSCNSGEARGQQEGLQYGEEVVEWWIIE